MMCFRLLNKVYNFYQIKKSLSVNTLVSNLYFDMRSKLVKILFMSYITEVGVFMRAISFRFNGEGFSCIESIKKLFLHVVIIYV